MLKEKDTITDNNKIIYFISEIIRERIINLKNSFINIQKILFQIKNKYSGTVVHPITVKYVNKFKTIETSSDKIKVFNKLDDIISSVFFQEISNIKNITAEKDYIYVGNLFKIQNSDHILISYLCNQIIDLINLNSDQYIKTNLIYLFSNIISYEYNYYNLREKANNNSEVKKFTLLESNYYNVFDENESDIFKQLSDDNTDDITDEQKEEIASNLYDESEKNDSIDVDYLDDNIDEIDVEEINASLSRGYSIGEFDLE
jgi:hypothetical protein